MSAKILARQADSNGHIVTLFVDVDDATQEILTTYLSISSDDGLNGYVEVAATLDANLSLAKLDTARKAYKPPVTEAHQAARAEQKQADAHARRVEKKFHGPDEAE